MATKEKIFWTTAASIATVGATVWAIFIYFKPPKETKTDPTITQNTNSGTNIGTVQQGGSVTIYQITPVGNILPDSSDAARMTLQKLGVSWSSDSFIGAIVDGDTKTVELFLKGGMSYLLNHKGASAVIYALQPGATNRLEIMKLFLKYNYRPNEDLLDARIMKGYGSIPPHFDQKETPKDYDASQGTFAGTADLWIAIRASYSGPKAGDLDILELLSKNGANFKTTLSFLRTDGAAAYDNTPVFWDVRNKIEKLANVATTKRPDKLY